MKTILNILKQPKFLVLQLISFVFLLFSNGISLLLPVISGDWLDEFLIKGQLPDGFYTLAIILAIASFVIPYIFALVSGYISELIGVELRQRLMRKYFSQNYEIYNKYQSGKLFTIFTSDISQIKDLTGRVINSLISALVLLLGSVILMLRYNIGLSIAVFLTVPLILIFAAFVIRRIGKIFKLIQESRDDLNRIIEENIKGSMLIRVFSAEVTEIAKFNKANEVFKNKSLQIVKYFAFLFPIINMSLYLGQLLVLYLGGRAAIYGDMSLGQISAFNMLVVMFTAPFIIISFIMNFISQAFVSLKRINDLLDTKIVKREGSIKIKEFKQLMVKNVDYERDMSYVLKGMNLEIKKGEKIGIIGTTASGKSSLMKVLLGILEISKGQILINGKDLKTMDLASYQGLFGYVAQTPQVFTGSIKENIKFYRDLKKEDMEQAVDVAMVSEFTDKFEAGLNNEVSERGTNLSGGQKQRIVLARALADSPQVLILDDATAKLDSVTEKEVFNRIKKAYPGLAIINVASKISSIKDSTRIYVLDKGKVVAMGTHEELKKNSYLYQEIELSQSNYHA